MSPTAKKSAVFLVMAGRRTGDKPISEVIGIRHGRDSHICETLC